MKFSDTVAEPFGSGPVGEVNVKFDGVSLRTVKVVAAVVEFPWASVTVTLIGHGPGPISVPAGGTCTAVNVPPQLSPAEKATAGAGAVQPTPTWTAAGWVRLTVGGVLSTTVTVCVLVAVFPCESVAE